ncbi:KAT8 regulatory NSL complex subunit 3-like [Babylonia areolata]|uniref:KAT8 regulatory NSL complex subunit 3-like n=1 Tax=Babylonia areolata TaxID=304850 RepID=UPI003FD243CA
MAQQDNSTSLTVRHRFSVSSSSFLTQLGLAVGMAAVGEQEMDVVMLDHCYAKPWSAHPDASSARPLRMLFMPKQTRPSTLEMLHRNVDPPIDVADAPPTPSMPFDINKARSLMTECERHASYARTDSQEDWEEKISKSGWTVQQTRLFTKVMKILQTDRLARLAMESVGNEPIARRQVVDKTAKRMRQALASVAWDTEVVQWLHQLILDNLSVHLLACYLDALQTLKAKVPSLVEKMVSGAPPKHPSLSHESLGLLLKRPWDPVGTALTQQKLKKLPGNPLLLIAPSGPTQSGSSHTGHAKRLKFWQVHLNSLGKTILTNMSGGSGVSVVLCLEQMIGALRTKVLEGSLKAYYRLSSRRVLHQTPHSCVQRARDDSAPKEGAQPNGCQPTLPVDKTPGPGRLRQIPGIRASQRGRHPPGARWGMHRTWAEAVGGSPDRPFYGPKGVFGGNWMLSSPLGSFTGLLGLEEGLPKRPIELD